jgi:hypothetical protein
VHEVGPPAPKQFEEARQHHDERLARAAEAMHGHGCLLEARDELPAGQYFERSDLRSEAPAVQVRGLVEENPFCPSEAQAVDDV